MKLHRFSQELFEAQSLAYGPNNLYVSNLVIEKESQEYRACQFIINNKLAKFRVAKITPTKVGQFVTFWKRSVQGPIVPFDLLDTIEFFIISVTLKNQSGQFVFPKSALIEHDILSKNNVGGKRGFRVYPPWDKVDNKQAIKTQAWQAKYFFKLDENSIDTAFIKQLFL